MIFYAVHHGILKALAESKYLTVNGIKDKIKGGDLNKENDKDSVNIGDSLEKSVQDTLDELIQNGIVDFISKNQIKIYYKKLNADEIIEKMQLEMDIASLREKLVEILNDEEYEDIKEELLDHINDLHKYNDLKDLGQSLLGRLAIYNGTTTREMYKEFDLQIDD